MKAAAPIPSPAPEAAAPAAPAAPQAAAAPSPQYVPPPAPAPQMAEGGGVADGGRKNPFKDFFSDVNVVDVAVSALIVAGVIYSIQYHRFMIMIEKAGYADLSSRIAKIEAEHAAIKRKAAEANAAGGMKRRRGLITL